MKFRPASIARSRMRGAVASSAVQPNCIVPRHSSETSRPDRPSRRYSIDIPPFLVDFTTLCSSHLSMAEVIARNGRLLIMSQRNLHCPLRLAFVALSLAGCKSQPALQHGTIYEPAAQAPPIPLETTD